MRWDAVIFDMDGLLLDTERLYIRLGQEYARSLGYSEIPMGLFRDCVGRKDTECVELFRKVMGEDFPAEAFRAKMDTIMREYADQHGMPPKPFASEILQRLHDAHVPTSIATSTARVSAFTRIRSVGWEGLFDLFTFGDEVEHGKPAPDIFLLAAQRLHAEPSRCVVLEDSPYGMMAACAAGMDAIWVPDLLGPNDFPELAPKAAGIFENLHEAAEFIFESR